MPEHLEGDQAVPGGQGDQLGADLVPPRREPRAVEGLHEHAVEGERQQRGIVQAAGDLLGLPGGLRARAPTRVPRDSRAIVASSRARAASCAPGGRAARVRSAAATICAACSGSSERVQIAGTSYAPITRAVSSRVAQLLGRRDGRHAVPAGRLQAAAPGHREVAQQPHRRLQPGPGAGRHGAVVGGGRLRPHPSRRPGRGGGGVEVGGVVEDVGLQAAQCRARIHPQLLDQERPGPAQHRQRVALAAGAVQREGQQPPGVLPPGVLGHVRVQIRHRLGGAGPGPAGPRPGARPPAAAAPPGGSAPHGPRARRRTRRRRARATIPAPRPAGRARPSAGSVAAAATAVSNRQASTASGSARSAYPGPSVTSSRAGARGGRSGSSARRRAATKVRTAPTAPGGGSSHRSSTRRVTGTTRRRATISRASTARCRGPFRAIAPPASSQAATGPSTPNTTRTVDQPPGIHPATT